MIKSPFNPGLVMFASNLSTAIRFISIATIFIILSLNLAAQDNKLDSLRYELTKEEDANQSAVLMYMIGRELAESLPDSALFYLGKSESIIDSLASDTHRGGLYISYSTAYSYKAEYDKSTQYAFKALEKGNLYRDSIVLYDANINLGIDFMYQEDYEESDKYYKRAETIAKALNSPYRLAHALNNLGLTAYYLGQQDQELAYYQEALEIFQSIGEKEGVGNTLLNIGTYYTEYENYDKADQLYQQALKIFEEIRYRSAYGHTLESMAENNSLRNNFKLARTQAEEALQLFIDNGNKQDQAYCYELLRDIFQRQGNYRTAYQYQEKFHEVFKNIFDEEKTKLITDSHLKYETARKQAEIAELELSNQLKEQEISDARNQIILMVGILVFILTLATFIIVIIRRKQKADHMAQALQYEVLQKRYFELMHGPTTYDLSLELDELNKRLVNPLTEREYEVLQLSLGGMTNKQIADKIFVSVSTIKFHLGNVYNKFGVSNKNEALEYVVKSS